MDESAIASEAPRRRVRMKPEVRRDQIVSHARQLFGEGGHAAFSLREVARSCGISLAAVQHHFGTRDQLLDEMIEATVTEHLTNIKALLTSPGNKAQAGLLDVVDYLMGLNSDYATAGFFLEFWAFAHHHPAGATARDRLYTPIQALIADNIRALAPELSAESASLRAGLVLATLDGLLTTSLLVDNPPPTGGRTSSRSLVLEAITDLYFRDVFP
jgi:AcrR family transcriptional regulator